MSDESSYDEGDVPQHVKDARERLTHLDKPLPHPRQDEDDDDDIAVGDDDEGAPDEEAG